MINWSESANFSLEVYRDESRPPLPSGWSIFMDCPPDLQKNGYFGSSYIACANPEAPLSQKVYFLVFSHRGTHDWIDMIQDFYVLLGEAPRTFQECAQPFIFQVREEFKKRYPEVPFVLVAHVGHSLGAALSELAVGMGSYEIAVTFESPGVQSIIEKLIQEKKSLPEVLDRASQMTYQSFANVDVINSCNAQISTNACPNFKIAPLAFFNDIVDEEGPNRINFAVNFTFRNQHKMLYQYQYWKDLQDQEVSRITQKADIKNFSDYFLECIGCIKALQNIALEGKENQAFIWPLGMDDSFNNHITYSNCFGKDAQGTLVNYWDFYTRSYWNAHPELQSKYENYEVYRDWYIHQSGYLKSSEQQQPTKLLKVIKRAPISMTLQERLAIAKDQDEQLYIAVYSGNHQLAIQLLKKQANPNTLHGLRKIPLVQIAIYQGDLEMMKILLDYGADPNARDVKGNTALHVCAMQRGQDGEYYALGLKIKGADARLKNSLEKSALEVVKEFYPLESFDRFKSVLEIF